MNRETTDVLTAFVVGTLTGLGVALLLQPTRVEAGAAHGRRSPGRGHGRARISRELARDIDVALRWIHRSRAEPDG